MRLDDIDDAAVRTALETFRSSGRFRTKDLSGHSVMKAAHRPYLSEVSYPGVVGKYLSFNAAALGISCDEPTRKSGNARWLFQGFRASAPSPVFEAPQVATGWTPALFRALIDAVRRGESPSATTRDLTRWFGFDRRGVQVDRLVLQAMSEHGIRSAPPFDLAGFEEILTFSSVSPLVVVAPPPPPVPSGSAQHPWALFAARIAAQTDLGRRVTLRVDALERLSIFLVSVLVAIARGSPGGQTLEAVRRLSARYLPRAEQPGAPVSFGAWVDLAQQIAPLVATSNDPLAAVLCVLFTTGMPGALLRDRVVPVRNEIHHASGVGADRYREIEAMLQDTAAALVAALRPLLDAELVCVHRTEPGEDHVYRYALRVLHGASRAFLARDLETDAKLRPGWAHLLREGSAPLRLAPGVFCVEDEATSEVEVYFARTFALDPRQPQKLLALAGTRERTELLPA